MGAEKGSGAEKGPVGPKSGQILCRRAVFGCESLTVSSLGVCNNPLNERAYMSLAKVLPPSCLEKRSSHQLGKTLACLSMDVQGDHCTEPSQARNDSGSLTPDFTGAVTAEGERAEER